MQKRKTLLLKFLSIKESKYMTINEDDIQAELRRRKKIDSSNGQVDKT